VPDCYLGFRLDPPAAESPEVLIVTPAVLLHPCVPQPDGTVLYELVTGHPDRQPRELVFVPDLTVELRAWPRDTWAKVGIDPQAAAHAIIGGWRRGDLPGLRLGALTAEEALGLERPAMTYVRAQLGDRLGRQLARAYRRWRHPTSGHLSGAASCTSSDPAGGGGVGGGHQPSGHHRQAAAVPDAPLTLPQCPPGGVPCGGHPGLDSRPRRGSAATVDTACGGCVHCRRRRACRDGRPPATAMSPPCSGEPQACRRRSAAVRPAPGRNPGRPADTAAVSGSADAAGLRARSAQPADSGGPNLRPRTRPADTRSPQAAGTVDTLDGGQGTRTLRQRSAGQPAAEPSPAAPARPAVGCQFGRRARRRV
jgi:hypothetical protein